MLHVSGLWENRFTKSLLLYSSYVAHCSQTTNCMVQIVLVQATEFMSGGVSDTKRRIFFAFF